MLKRRFVFLFFMLLCFLGVSCSQLPKDPEDTLQKVQGTVLDVGYSENRPWVVKREQGPQGREPELVRAFAKTLNADIRWHQDTEQNLLEALEEKKLQLVIAGLTDDSPWKNKISFTRPYFKEGKKKHVFAVIMGENDFITRLEKFLHQQEDQLKNRYGHETSR